MRRGKRASKAKGWKRRELFRRVIITNAQFPNEDDFCKAVRRALSTEKPIIEHLEGEKD